MATAHKNRSLTLGQMKLLGATLRDITRTTVLQFCVIQQKEKPSINIHNSRDFVTDAAVHGSSGTPAIHISQLMNR